jgi:tetratricopeptide (TPR) repeat protein
MVVDSSRRPPTDCPDSEALAEYVDGRLGPTGRAVLEAHLVDCEDCRAVLVETAAIAPRPVTPFWQSNAFLGSAAGLAAALVLVAGGAAVFERFTSDRAARPVDSELRRLAAAFSAEARRPTEGRLTGDFGYGAPPSAVRAGADADTPGGPGSSQAVPARARVEIAAIERQAQEAPSADHDAALGVAYLVGGDLDEAIAALRHASEGRPDEARFWSDLSVAYLKRGARHASRSDFEQALKASEYALTLHRDMPEAMFNRAIALEHLGATEDAVAAWNDSKRLDPSSPWSREAEERLRALSPR